MNRRQQALLTLGRALKGDGYKFVAPTPLTYKRVLARPRPAGADPLIEAFGWNRPYDARALDDRYRSVLEDGDLCERAADGSYRSLVRFSSLDGLLFAHSGFPTDTADAVFFGPDTYRFCQALRAVGERDSHFHPRNVIDVGAGTGAGGLYARTLFPGIEEINLADINDKALQFAEVNAALNEAGRAQCRHSDVLAGVAMAADLIISNPPYLVDAGRRAYRHGGGVWGCDLAVRIAEQALSKLTKKGRLVLYTGSPIVGGKDMFLEAITPLLERRTSSYRYEETDPDVFGEELGQAPYDRADRIATVVLNVKGEELVG
jgi:hypothetical protein